jgi:putative hydrolase of the HAD superfamily
MNEIKTVLFDVYGTLIDIHTDEHRDDIFETLSRFLEYRRVFVSPHELKELYFSEINRQFAASRQKFPEIDIVAAFERVLRRSGGSSDRYLALITTQLYRCLSRQRLGLFRDTFWTLTEFRKRYRLAVVSDAQRVFCRPELRSLHIEGFFDTLVISSDYGFRKPDPRLFHIALAAVDSRPEESAYIGNRYETDFQGARAAGLAVTILIHQSPADIEAFRGCPQPDGIAADLTEAYQMLRRQAVVAQDDHQPEG